jgi:predicted nucleic acid-binding protein
MNIFTFIDTSYILALVDADDEYYAEANRTAATVGKMVTTEAVLTEIGNALSQIRWRQIAIDNIEDLCNDPDIEVVSIDKPLFDRAFQFYSSRLDKEWSLTDCISFVIMQERGIVDALTTDRHFQQAGFRAILRELKRNTTQE